MRIITLIVTIVPLAALITGCSGLSAREQRVLSGGAIAAGAGAATSLITGGSVRWDAAVGAGAGFLGGFIDDEIQRKS